MGKQKRNSVSYILGSLLVALILVWTAVFAESVKSQEGLLEVTFFDVGQGDAIFIETPGGRQILIDGGPDDAVLERLGEVMPFYDRDIDLVILTHPDRDHIAGLVEVLKRYRVHTVLDNGIPKNDEVYKAYRDLIAENNIPYYALNKESNIKLGDSIRMTIFHPGSRTYQKSNDNSIVLRLDFGEDSFLFTGDIEKGAEFEMIGDEASLDVDVLKVAHHGSKTSTTRLFLEKVTPELAVISVGKENRYGHPHPSVLENLAHYGIRVLRTDEDGNIRIFSDGEHTLVR